MNLMVWSIVVSFGNMFSIKCITKLVSWFLDNNKENRKLMDEISLLKKEQSEISMIQEFSKHAKLQRRINKLNEELKHNIRKNASKNLEIKLFWKISSYFLFVVFNLLFVSYNYRQIVLNEIPSSWFSPLSWLVSWPLSQVGTMSFVFWYSITNCVAKITTSYIF